MFVTPNCVGTSGHTALFHRDPTALVWEGDLIAAQSGHPAWGYDSESNEVFVYVGSDTFRMTRLSDGTSTDLLHLANRCSCSWAALASSGYHLSTIHKVPGWVVVSMYGNQQAWLTGMGKTGCPLDFEVFAIELNPNKRRTCAKQPTVWRIAHTRSHASNYYNQARTQVDWEGRYIYFDSNWLDQNTPRSSAWSCPPPGRRT